MPTLDRIFTYEVLSIPGGWLFIIQAMYIVINELEKDVLREIINIGLARAADSFANFSHHAVLLAVPEIKIIEPHLLPDVIQEYEDTYQIIRSQIAGELSGRTYLLFSEEHTEKLSEVYLSHIPKSLKPDYVAEQQALLLGISQIITKALADELQHLLQVKLRTATPEALYNHQQLPIAYILQDLPKNQPFVIAVKTHFQRMVNSVQVPLVIILEAPSISKFLAIIRRDNLYNFKLLQEKV